VVKFKKNIVAMIEDEEKDIKEPKNCAACLGSKNRIITGYIDDLSCGHYFHQICLNKHFEEDPTVLICPRCGIEDKTTHIFGCKQLKLTESNQFITSEITMVIFISPNHSLYDLIIMLSSILSMPPYKLTLSINDTLFVKMRNNWVQDIYIQKLHHKRPPIVLEGNSLKNNILANLLGKQFNSLLYTYNNNE
jgi:rubredoxin